MSVEDGLAAVHPAKVGAEPRGPHDGDGRSPGRGAQRLDVQASGLARDHPRLDTGGCSARPPTRAGPPAPAGWCRARGPRPGRRRPPLPGSAGCSARGRPGEQVGLRAGHLCRRLVPPTGRLDVGRVELAPELVDRLGRSPGHHCGQHRAELAADRVPDPVELGVGDVDQSGEPGVGPVLRLEVDGYADRTPRQVAVQPAGDQPGVTAAVGLEQLDRVVHVGGEAAEPDAVVAVPVRRRTVGNLVRGNVDVGDLGVGSWLLRGVREDGADGGGHASGEERRDVD